MRVDYRIYTLRAARVEQRANAFEYFRKVVFINLKQDE